MGDERAAETDPAQRGEKVTEINDPITSRRKAAICVAVFRVGEFDPIGEEVYAP